MSCVSDCCDGLVNYCLHGPLAFVESGRLVPAITHRVAVIEQHEVMRGAATEEAQPFVAENEMRQHQHEHGDNAHSREEQQQLLEEDPASVTALAFEQELHRGPFDALLPAQVDQMDQDRHRDERQADCQKRGKKERQGRS